MNKLFIVGAGGFGREAAYVAQLMGRWDVLFFIDEIIPINSKINNIIVIGGLEYLMNISGEIFIAIGNHQTRKNLVSKLSTNNKLSFPNIIHPSINWVHSKLNKIGYGNYLGEGVTGTVNISIGNFNLINIGCILSHDTEIESYCNLMHGVKITSGANISDSVNIGAGACIVSKALIGPSKVIGANRIFPECGL